MKVSIDGGLTYVEAPQGIRVCYEDQMMPGEDEDGDVLFSFTSEGLIIDVWTDADENIGTSSETIDEVIERLVEANS